MIGNETSVSFKPFGAKIWAKNSISSMEYDLATEEEIARVVARKLNEPPEQLPTVDNVLKMLQSKMISVDEAKRFLGFA